MKQNYSSSSSSSSYPQIISPSPNSETRNWLELPSDITATILLKVGAIDILNNAQLVCTQWRSISKDPDLWRVIDMTTNMEFDSGIMCRHAIDRSQGNLVSISLSYFGSDDLLHCIADSASYLQRLRLVCCHDVSDKGLSEVAEKLPCLEELDLTVGSLSGKSLEAIGRCCSLLKSLKFNMQSSHCFGDKVAFAIAHTMPNLRHLQLYRNNELTNEGLLAILDGCPYIESLDLQKCFNVDLEGSLGRRCAEQIKDLVKPGDSLDDYPFNYDEYWKLDDYLSACDEYWQPDDYLSDYDDYGHQMLPVGFLDIKNIIRMNMWYI